MSNNSVTSISSFWPLIEFSLFLCGQLFSTPCYLCHLLAKKTAGKSLQNHDVVVNLIDLSILMSHSRTGYVPLFSEGICLL
jgi:hypothetical protein